MLFRSPIARFVDFSALGWRISVGGTACSSSRVYARTQLAGNPEIPNPGRPAAKRRDHEGSRGSRRESQFEVRSSKIEEQTSLPPCCVRVVRGQRRRSRLSIRFSKSSRRARRASTLTGRGAVCARKAVPSRGPLSRKRRRGREKNFLSFSPYSARELAFFRAQNGKFAHLSVLAARA